MTTPVPDTRNSLIARLPDKQDAEAWEQFVSIYEPLVYRLARSKGFQGAEAREIVQEVLVAVAGAVQRWEPDPAKGRFQQRGCHPRCYNEQLDHGKVDIGVEMNVQPSPVTRCTVFLTAFFAAQLDAAPPRRPGDVETANRKYKTASGETLDYDLGTLFVPENRSDPTSRIIGVGFVRFRSFEQPAKSPPLFHLPGGPGMSFVGRIKSAGPGKLDRIFPELGDFLRHGDVVYVDQRGFSEGGDVFREAVSHSPRKPRELPTAEDEVADFKTFARETVEKYSNTHVDLRAYTVKECAADVDQLRQALGYEQITLMGTSFGSQWSFAVMRQHPGIVARALLSGVEPLDHTYDMPSHVFAAVQRMWLTIDQDERFKPYLPDGGMAEAARVVIDRLERESIKLEISDLESGKRKVVGHITATDFPWNDPIAILELYHRRIERWAQRAARTTSAPRERQINLIFPLIDTSLGVTPERRYRLWNDPATRYLGRGGFAPFLVTTGIWPSPDVGDGFRTPERSDIPVVFAQGDWDTQTPIENTLEIAPFFTNSRVLFAQRGGHGVLDNIAREHPTTWAELVEFLRNGDMEGIPARVTMSPSRRFSPPSFGVPLK